MLGCSLHIVPGHRASTDSNICIALEQEKCLIESGRKQKKKTILVNLVAGDNAKDRRRRGM